VLFIGGTGVISAACAQRAVEAGFDLFLMNRGTSISRSAPPEAQVLLADIRDRPSVTQAVAGLDFDVVVDFLAFTPDHVGADIDLFRGRIGQYVFISSASAYQTPPARLPVVESTPLRNPYWQYSRDKIACEDHLVRLYRDEGFPATIVRPSHTYDRTMMPLHGGWTVIDRMRRGDAIVVHGDGSSPWTLTHADDFARAFVGLLGQPRAIGDSFHITSDDVGPDRRNPRGRGGRAPSDRARAVGRRGGARPGVGCQLARRQGARHGVRQHQDQAAGSRLGGQGAVLAGCPGDRRVA
jgi:nucleoside-diphosphate-sugar epimerase